MTIWIIPELDRKGWAVCLFWLQGGEHDEAPTDRNSCLIKTEQETFKPPPLFEERGTNRIQELRALPTRKKTNLTGGRR